MAAITNSERSGPHRRVEKILDEMKIPYLSEEQFSPYKVDIYLPSWHLVIEVDGPYHSKSKDEVRDAWLKARYGLLVLRIDARIWHSKTEIQKKVLEFLEEHADTFEDRKMVWLTAL